MAGTHAVIIVKQHAVSTRLIGFCGELHLDPEEVHETRWAHIKEVQEDTAEHPHMYTQWMLEEMQRMQWLQGMPAACISCVRRLS